MRRMYAFSSCKPSSTCPTIIIMRKVKCNFRMDRFYFFLLLIVNGPFLFMINGADTGRQAVKIGLYIDGLKYNITQLKRTVACTVTYVNNQRQIFPNMKLEYVIKTSPNNGYINAGFRVCEMMKEGAIGLISMTSCKLSQYLTDVSKRYGLPHILIPLPLCGLRLNVTSYSIRPNRSALLDLLLDVVKHKRWNRITMVYDDTMGAFAIDFTLAMTAHSVRVFAIRVPNKLYERETKDTLAKIKNSKINRANIMLLTNAHNALALFETAKIEGLQSGEYLWLQVEQAFSERAILRITKPHSSMLLVDDPHPIGCGGVMRNLLGLGCSFQVENGHEALLVDAILTLSHVINNATQFTNFTNMRPGSCKKREKMQGMATVQNVLQVIKVEGITGTITFDNDHHRNFSSSQDAFVFDSSSTGNNTDYARVGSWNSQNGLLIKNVLYPNQLTPFENQTLRITVKEVPPFVYKVIKNSDGTIEFEGFCKVILSELAKRLHFRYVTRLVRDSKFGTQEANGTWNGMVGEVKRGEADLGVGPLTVTSTRSKVIDFTIPYMQDSVGFIMKTPERPNKMFQFLRPFTGGVWLALFITLLVVGVTSWFVNHFTPNSGFKRSAKDSTSDEEKLKENMWFILGLFLSHGPVWYPMSSSGRVLTLSLAFFTAIISAHYTADLVAYLAVPPSPNYIKTLQELTSQDRIKPLLLDGSNLVTLFNTSNDDVYKKLWTMLQGGPSITDNEDAEELMRREGKWAFLNDMSQIEYIITQNCSEYVSGVETFNRAGFGFLMPNGSSHARAINDMIRKMQESGLMQRWRKQWWKKSLTCKDDTKVQSLHPMDLESASGGLMLVCAGLVAGFLVLMLELAIHFGGCWKRGSESFHNHECNDARPIEYLGRTNWSFSSSGSNDGLTTF